MSERESQQPEPTPDETEEVGIDFVDPLKRDDDEDGSMPGLDPVVTLPPE